MEHLNPDIAIMNLSETGLKKSVLSINDILIRSFLSGALLGIATALAITTTVQTGLGVAGAIVFPVGFVMLVLLGLELVTGNFATIPMAILNKSASMKNMGKNWTFAYIGNLLGSIFFGVLFYIAVTNFGLNLESEVVKRIISIASQKTIQYKDIGSLGLVVSIAKAILCNWMVTMGVVMGALSKSTSGKIAAMWLPIFTFFALGFEHCVVNMFLIPTAMLMQAPITFSDWWLWNQIPVTIGNLIGGFLLTGLTLHLTFKKQNQI